ncbi:hypothetical protein BKA80DRAFT_274875 [Phyllosticta citrichinensis]
MRWEGLGLMLLMVGRGRCGMDGGVESLKRKAHDKADIQVGGRGRALMPWSRALSMYGITHHHLTSSTSQARPSSTVQAQHSQLSNQIPHNHNSPPATTQSQPFQTSHPPFLFVASTNAPKYVSKSLETSNNRSFSATSASGCVVGAKMMRAGRW